MNNGFWNKVNSWYENIGEKLKVLAKWTFIVESICFIIGGIVLFFVGISQESWSYYGGYYSDPNVGMIIGGLAAVVIGPIIAFVSSWLLYAFGHLVQTTEDNYKLNARQNNSAAKKSEAQAKADYERMKKIEALRSAGMITEEEYLDAVAKINNGGAE